MTIEQVQFTTPLATPAPRRDSDRKASEQEADSGSKQLECKEC